MTVLDPPLEDCACTGFPGDGPCGSCWENRLAPVRVQLKPHLRHPRCPCCGRLAWRYRLLGWCLCPVYVGVGLNSGSVAEHRRLARLELVLQLTYEGATLSGMAPHVPRWRPSKDGDTGPLAESHLYQLRRQALDDADRNRSFLLAANRWPFAGHDWPASTMGVESWRMFSKYRCAPAAALSAPVRPSRGRRVG